MELNTRLLSLAIRSVDQRIEMPYRLFVPDGYTDAAKYPLVLWLHGAGERGDDNLKQLDMGVSTFVSPMVQQVQECFVMAPQCPIEHQWVENGEDVQLPLQNYRVDEVKESVWFELIFKALVDLEQQYRIDNDRIYVSGFSMGATGTWDIIVRHPDFFAAALPMSGRNDPSMANRIARIPIWAFHGKLDSVSPVTNTRAMAAALKWNNSTVMVTELWRKHHIISYVLKRKEIYEWLFSQRR